MVIPSIAQLHDGLLGAHIQSTDLDRGSANAVLVCGPNDTVPMFTKVHPSIKFDEAMGDVGVQVVGGPAGKVIWDTHYALAGKKVLPADAEAAGGKVPNWTKICTPRGAVEQYKMIIQGTGLKSGQFTSSSTFTANNAQAVQLPHFVFPRKPFHPGVPQPAVIAPFNAERDFNPLSYL